MYRSLFRFVRQSCRIFRSLFGFYSDLQRNRRLSESFESESLLRIEQWISPTELIFSAINHLLLKAGRVLKLDGIYLARSGAISSLKGRFNVAARSISCGDHTVVVKFFAVLKAAAARTVARPSNSPAGDEASRTFVSSAVFILPLRIIIVASIRPRNVSLVILVVVITRAAAIATRFLHPRVVVVSQSSSVLIHILWLLNVIRSLSSSSSCWHSSCRVVAAPVYSRSSSCCCSVFLLVCRSSRLPTTEHLV